MHCSGEGCPKQSIGSARLKRRLRPTSVGSLGRSPNDFCVLFFTEKDGPAGKRANYAFAKGFAPPLGDCKPGPTTGGN